MEGKQGLALGGLILAVLAIFVPILGVLIGWLALGLATVAAANGERSLTIATVAVCFVDFVFLTPSLWVASIFAGTNSFAQISVAMLVVPVGAMVLRPLSAWNERVVARRAARHGQKSTPGHPQNPGGRCAILIGDGAFRFPVVGESHYQDILARLAGGKHRNAAHSHHNAALLPEPDNPYDPEAVRVVLEGETVAYFTRPTALEFLDALEAQGFSAAVCRAEIVGGWRREAGDEGSFGVRLDARRPFVLRAP